MHSPTLVAGDPVAARCTKCRKNTDHHIVTMAEEAPATVRCSICTRQHKYRPPSAAKKAAPSRAVSSRDAERLEWEGLQLGMNSAKVTDYSMTAAFKVESVINHPVFGLGLVRRVAGPRKVEVLFADGKKTMRCK